MQYLTATGRLWLARLVSLALFSLLFAGFTNFGALLRRDKAADIWQDPRYASVLQEIQSNNLKISKINVALTPNHEKTFAMTFFGLFLADALIVGAYSLIYIFVSPLILKKPDDSTL